jgi:hypothetical protein
MSENFANFLSSMPFYEMGATSELSLSHPPQSEGSIALDLIAFNKRLFLIPFSFNQLRLIEYFMSDANIDRKFQSELFLENFAITFLLQQPATPNLCLYQCDLTETVQPRDTIISCP